LNYPHLVEPLGHTTCPLFVNARVPKTLLGVFKQF
jgi:hypothetical protein